MIPKSVISHLQIINKDKNYYQLAHLNQKQNF